MICKLTIKNFAIIKHVEIYFKDGFSALSGETGAGKSIMIDAIALLMGKRSDKGLLFDKNIKCVLELSLLVEKNKRELFIKNNLKYESKTIIKREISSSGKSRSFINNTPVSLSTLNSITSNFIEIFSQNQSLNLKSSENQLDLIDKISQSNIELLNYQKLYKEYIFLNNELENIKETNTLSPTEIDFLKFQINELENSKLKIDEKEELESEFKLLENSSTILEFLSNTFQNLSKENGINSRIFEIENNIKKVSNFSNTLTKLKERIISTRIELQDIEDDIRIYSESINTEPEKLDKISSRLDNINNLLVKYRKKEVSELLELLNQLKSKLKASSDYDTFILEKKEEIYLTEKKLLKSSKILSKKRKSICKKFADEIKNQLKELGIKSPIFIVDIIENRDFTIKGSDEIKFLFSANKGTNAQELNRVASGGELSRLMLCISNLTSNYYKLSCLIFDEIDTGVSGEIADLMSEMMKNISQNKQVISVTHLPQIASKAKNHYKVFKNEMSNKTVTEIKLLNTDERVIEIAKMLSGKKVTDTSISNAKELLNQ